MLHALPLTQFSRISLVLLAALALLPAAPLQAQTDERCFDATGYCISGRIRQFWEQNGALPVFGYPISPQQEERVGAQTLQVQWFERARLELHPENPAPYDVQMGRLGVEILARQGRDWTTFPKLDPNNADAESCRYFRETDHAVCGEFLQAYRRYGLSFPNMPGVTPTESLALFGLPISEPITETLSDGKAYTVQWFERARFELHPENAAPFKVLFGRLGEELRASSGGPAVPGLVGTSWQLVEYGPAAAPTPAVAGSPATLAFGADQRASGSTGCNNFSGSYQVAGDQITFGPLISTLRACEEALTQQERAVFTALQGTVRYEVAGDQLRIFYDGGNSVLRYTRASAAGGNGAAALTGKTWTLTGYGPVNAPAQPVAGAPATIVFGADGSVSGSTGCNSFNGGYTVAGDQLTFGPLATTLRACEEALAQQESTIFTALQGTLRYEVAGDQLRIFYGGGQQALVYSSAAQPAATASVTGTVTYRERIALPPGAVVLVQLQEVSRADAPALVIAEDSITTTGQQVPIPFAIRYDPAQINPAGIYIVRGEIRIDGQLRFTTTETYRVITQGNPTTVELVLRSV